jgi:hypothetical protein
MSRIVRFSHRSCVSCDEAGDGFGFGRVSDDVDCEGLDELRGLILILGAGFGVSFEELGCGVLVEGEGLEASRGGVAVGVDEGSGVVGAFAPLVLDAGEAAEEPPSLARRLLRIYQGQSQLRNAAHVGLRELRKATLSASD